MAMNTGTSALTRWDKVSSVAKQMVAQMAKPTPSPVREVNGGVSS
jgi:hypothetical protein